MKLTRLKLGLVALTVVAAATSTMAFHGTNEEDSTPFDKLKALAGTWVMLDEDGNPTDEVMSTIKVTTGGSAVLDTEFPDTEKEMLTVFTMNKGQLELHHYCILGNAPVMIANADSGSDELIFDCNGEGPSLDCAKDKHMHNGHYHFHGKDRMSNTWNMIENGQVIYTA
ncbi:MAG: hypothetical protein ACI841_002727 [Planctomycetota bacterium]|jgi:hypothetical protein